ncbi:arginine--tRNA ligase [Verrucomicrobia bacterium LW23]|nr:arginine--tRNA ligase [Verrucomicrobia bacterium LW23]
MIPTPRQEVETLVAQVVTQLFGDRAVPGPYVRPCPDTRHGDFQTNVAMVQAKSEKANPRDLAAKVVAALGENDIIAAPEIAGPGFVNFRLKDKYVGANVLSRLHDTERLGCGKAAQPLTLVLDYSGPNVAKELHVGHLRSTILGDALARVQRFLGQKVIADNHIGDWGTQFGIAILGYKQSGDPQLLEQDPIGHLEDLYIRTSEKCKAEPELREAAKAELVKLQALDPENVALWKHFVKASIDAMEELYHRMDVRFDYTLGESFYNDMLPGVVAEFKDKGIARNDEGAIRIFFDNIEALKNEPLAIQKSDGAFLYATTDLATIEYRVDTINEDKKWKADSIIYVTDGRQQLHFKQIFAAARMWRYDESRVRLEHVWFGKVLGPNKKALSTRDGGTLKLKELLDEAESRAQAILSEKRPDLSAEESTALAKVLGIGAVKYADMAQNRNLDYVFDWNKLLAFDGNTAPYIINAYVRTQAVFRKAGSEPAPADLSAALPDGLILTDPAELTLAKKLIDFEESVKLVAEESRPHYLCVYLFDLATIFHQFYEACPILKGDNPEAVRLSRLALTSLTGRTLKLGLSLLGIQTVDRM